MTNAQITIPIIIGLTLLIAISLITYLSTLSIQQTPRQAHTTTLTKPITEYITSCLTLAAQNTLTTLGMQGGILYQQQGSTTPNQLPQEHGISYATIAQHHVPYLIHPPQQRIGTTFSSTPPEYPWETFPNLNGKRTDIGYFGINTLNPLYNTSPHSIQEQLQTTISKQTQECTDWTSFESQGLSINTGEPHTTMILASNISQLTTEESISFTLTWPIDITTKETTTTLTDFTTTLPIPFGRIYYTIKNIIDQEVQNINTEPHHNDTITYINKNIISNDDLITLQFPNTPLHNTPYTFQFLRHNRPPALHYINPTLLNTHTWHAGIQFSIKNTTLIIKDPCPDTNAPTTLHLTTSDPDNDTTTYSLEPTNPLQFTEPSGNKPPYEWRITTTDGQYTDSQTLRLTLTCCPEGCP